MSDGIAVLDPGIKNQEIRGPGDAAIAKMVWVPGGEFAMGSSRYYPEEAPVHRVIVDGFWIDPTTVTNREFARFVADTGYITLAERPADRADYPDVPLEG